MPTNSARPARTRVRTKGRSALAALALLLPLVMPHRAVAQASAAIGTAAAAAAAPATVPFPPARAWELRLTSGSLLPVGDQHRQLRSGPLTAAQLSWAPRASLAVTGTLTWARSRDRLASGTPRIDALTADVGVETRAATRSAGRAMAFRPFVGVGAGTRRYDRLGVRGDATQHLAGYGAVGGELGVGRVGVRLEVRDYLSGARTGRGGSMPRNDVAVMVAFRFTRHGAPAR